MIVPIPVCPILFNSFGFAYFTVSLISSATSVQNAPIYIIEAILGNIILNGSIVLILGYLTKRAMKKAARTSAAANK
jgi:hypothetical protein